MYKPIDILALLIQVNLISADSEGYHIISGLESAFYSWDGVHHTVEEVLAHVLSANTFGDIGLDKGLILDPARSLSIIKENSANYD